MPGEDGSALVFFQTQWRCRGLPVSDGLIDHTHETVVEEDSKGEPLRKSTPAQTVSELL